ncbi:MAG: tetratricopeptide repeat protein [Bacteroidetes bacterium]|nr:tetratricopeptide repeat protein [Bacteroidota bacterium]
MNLPDRNKVLLAIILNVLLAIILLVSVFISYYPSLENEFTNWDDHKLVTKNSLVRDLSPTGIQAIFTSYRNMHYKPLVILSWALEYKRYGFDPFFFHRDNLLLHLLNSLLVFVFLSRLFDIKIAAFTAALLFGVHPVHVESVAWVSERKDLLYGFFYLLSLVAYLEYRRKEKLIWTTDSLLISLLVLMMLFISVTFFLLSMLSKMQAITLPLVLILLDLFYTQRHDGNIFKRINWPSKIPYVVLTLFALSILGGFTKLEAQLSSLVSTVTVQQFDLLDKLVIMNYEVLFYFLKMLVPFKLSAIYPYPGNLPLHYYLAPIVNLGMIIGFILLAKRQFEEWDPLHVIFGLLFFVVTLIPVLQLFFPMRDAVVADRFLYIPSIGFLAAICSLLGYREGIKSWVWVKVVIGILVIGLGWLTYNQTKVWKNSFTLWTDVISKFPSAGVAYLNRGNAYGEAGDTELALKDYSNAILIDSRSWKALNNRSNIYKESGELAKALEDLDRAIDIYPDYAVGLTNRGLIRLKMGDPQSALLDLNRAIELNPNDVNSYLNRGSIYEGSGKYQEAIRDYDEVLRLRPGYAVAYSNKGNAYAAMGNGQQALTNYNFAINIAPDFAQAWNNRAILFIGAGDPRSAINDLNKDIELYPFYY